MSTILENIIAHKRDEVAFRRNRYLMRSMINDISNYRDLPRGFIQALRDKADNREVAIIAEVKQASPSQGVITNDFDPVEIAKKYAENGATCLSVLTDEQYFKGHDEYFRSVRSEVTLPVIRKDFIIDEYQVAESRLLGADAILLIVAALDDSALRDYTLMAHDLGMDVLVEVHNADEMTRALRLPIQAIGINNRNLHDFSVDLTTSVELKKEISDEYLLVSESGIQTAEDISLLCAEGIYTYLIGGSLMAQEDPGRALSNLINGVIHD